VRDLVRGLLRARPGARRQPVVLTEGHERPDSWRALDYVHDRIAGQLQEQSRLWEEADGRLRLVLGVIGVIFAAILGLLPRATLTVTTPDGSGQQPLYLPFWVGALAVTALAMYAVAGLVAAVAYWPRTFSWPPAPEAMRNYVTTDPREVKLIVVDEMLEAYAANGRSLASKLRLFRWAFVVATAATGLLGLSVIIEVLQATRAWGG
jgi:hypothetical protein